LYFEEMDMSGLFPSSREDFSMASRVFMAESSLHGKLVDLYLMMPFMTEVFNNVVHDRPLCQGVLSQYTEQTLTALLVQHLSPVFLECGLVRADASKCSGFATDFTGIVFADLTAAEMLIATKGRSEDIALSCEEGDTRSHLLTANLHFPSLSASFRAEMFAELRSVLRKYMALPDALESEGTPFRLSLIARGEPKETE